MNITVAVSCGRMTAARKLAYIMKAVTMILSLAALACAVLAFSLQYHGTICAACESTCSDKAAQHSQTINHLQQQGVLLLPSVCPELLQAFAECYSVCWSNQCRKRSPVLSASLLCLTALALFTADLIRVPIGAFYTYSGRGLVMLFWAILGTDLVFDSRKEHSAALLTLIFTVLVACFAFVNLVVAFLFLHKIAKPVPICSLNDEVRKKARKGSRRCQEEDDGDAEAPVQEEDPRPFELVDQLRVQEEQQRVIERKQEERRQEIAQRSSTTSQAPPYGSYVRSGDSNTLEGDHGKSAAHLDVHNYGFVDTSKQLGSSTAAPADDLLTIIQAQQPVLIRPIAPPPSEFRASSSVPTGNVVLNGDNGQADMADMMSFNPEKH